MRRLMVLLLAGLGLLSACGSDAGSRSGQTVVVTPSDAGRTVSIHIGDRLVFDLGAPPRATWTLAAYPQEALAVASTEPDEGRFEFQARAPGRGQVLLIMQVGCPPGSVTPCASGAVGGDDFPLRPFRVTVEVS